MLNEAGGAGAEPPAKAAAWQQWPLVAAPPPALLTLATRALLLAFLALTFYWLAAFYGGLAWLPLPEPVADDPDRVSTKKMFNVHIAAMALAFAAASEAIVSYRAAGWAAVTAPPPCRKRQKATHAVLQATAGVLVAAGLGSAFASHLLRVPPIVSLYSTHSWVGLLAVALLAGNFALATWAYWMQRPSHQVRIYFEGPTGRSAPRSMCGLWVTLFHGLVAAATLAPGRGRAALIESPPCSIGCGVT